MRIHDTRKKDAFFKQLERKRRELDEGCWHEVANPRPNEPRLVVHTAQCLAEGRGLKLAELADLTTANALRLFARET